MLDWTIFKHADEENYARSPRTIEQTKVQLILSVYVHKCRAIQCEPEDIEMPDRNIEEIEMPIQCLNTYCASI